MEPQHNHNRSDISAAVKSRDIDAILAAYAEDAVIYDCRDALQVDQEVLRPSWKKSFQPSENLQVKLRNFEVKVSRDFSISFSFSHSARASRDRGFRKIILNLKTQLAHTV